MNYQTYARDARPVIADPLVPYADAMNRYLGLSRSTAERMAKRGEIKTVPFGRRVLVRQSELDRIIQAAEQRVVDFRASAGR